ncbi:MAG: energy transducer TonB, partial [Pontixanthobacter sp.]
METPRWRIEEIVGLGVAVVLHLVLLAMLLLKPEPVVIEPVQTVTVSLAEDVSLEATAPEPIAESRLAMAPALSDIPAPPVPEPVEAPKPVQTAAPT